MKAAAQWGGKCYCQIPLYEGFETILNFNAGQVNTPKTVVVRITVRDVAAHIKFRCCPASLNNWAVAYAIGLLSPAKKIMCWYPKGSRMPRFNFQDEHERMVENEVASFFGIYSNSRI